MKIPGAAEALEHVASWAARQRWKEECEHTIASHFVPVCEKAGITEDDLAELLGPHHYGTAKRCAFEDFLSCHTGPKQPNVIDDYLEHRGWRESIQARDYLRALRDSVMSLYEAVEVRPGRGLVLRDLVRAGEPLEVDEQLGSESMARWDRLGARILSIAGRHYLSGAVLHFPPEPADAVVRIFRESSKQARQTLRAQLPTLTVERRRALDEMLGDKTVALERSAPVFTLIWLAYTIRRLKAPGPKLVNFEGERLVFAKVRFAVGQESRAEVIHLLDAVEEFARERHARPVWTWHTSEGTRQESRAKGSGHTSASWNEDDALVLGRIELREKWLMLEVNSAERAERGRKMLKGLLGGLVGEPLTETQSVESALEEYRERERRGQEPDRDDPKLPPEEAARILHESMDRHYRRVLDEQIPALGDVTPRDAVATADGREKVIGWLKFLENGEGRRARDEGTEPYDFTWMWRELGVLEERR